MWKSKYELTYINNFKNIWNFLNLLVTELFSVKIHDLEKINEINCIVIRKKKNLSDVNNKTQFKRKYVKIEVFNIFNIQFGFATIMIILKTTQLDTLSIFHSLIFSAVSIISKSSNVYSLFSFKLEITEQFENFLFVKTCNNKDNDQNFLVFDFSNVSASFLSLFFTLFFFYKKIAENQFNLSTSSLVIKNVVRKIERNYFTSGYYKKQKKKPAKKPDDFLRGIFPQ